MSIYQDIEELVESKLTEKQRDRYFSMSGYFAKRLRKITKAKWAEVAISEVESKEQNRRDQEHAKFIEFKKLYHEKKFSAKVLWFRTSDGTGVVRLETGLRLPIYACNIEGKKTWYPETACVYYENGQDIEVQIEVHGGFKAFVIGLTPGNLDSEKWNEIKDKNLAFKCNAKGEAENGLFE